MDELIVEKGNLSEVNVVSSKSYLHRYLIMLFIAKDTKVINNISLCEDIIETIYNLNNLGANITYTSTQINFSYDGIIKNEFIFNRSGSTYRFLKPLIYKIVNKPNIILGEQLKNRPDIPYNGIENKINDNNIEIDASISSQFVSGILFLKVYNNEESVVTLINRISSLNYLLMTIEVINKFGFNIKIKNNQIQICKTKIISPHIINIESDYSAIAFFVAHSLINKTKVKIKNVHKDSLQADYKILSILQENIDFKFENNDLIVTYKNNKPINTNIDNSPDLGPILFVCAMFLKGASHISGLERLKYKESNRIETSITFLNSYNIKYNLSSDEIKINGEINKITQPKTFDSKEDHRIAMSAAILGLYVGVKITDYKAVNKSFPTFFDELSKNNIKLH